MAGITFVIKRRRGHASGFERAIPVGYYTGYGKNFDKQSLSRYQRALGVAMVVVSALQIDDYRVVCLAGSLRRVPRGGPMSTAWT